MYKSILVPLDGSGLAECVLPHVESIVKGCGVGKVTFLRVVSPVSPALSTGEYAFSEEDARRVLAGHKGAAEDYLNQLVNRIQYNGVNVRTEVVTGKAADSIADYAARNEVDLIVIATHGHSGISRWVWGSVTGRILRSACVPVLTVRAPGCVPGI